MQIMDKETDINPLSQLYDELKTILSGLVVKFSVYADKYETLETRKYSDTYISAVNKTDSFGLYEYTESEFNDAGIYDKEIIAGYQSGDLSIPSSLSEKLLLNRREYVIKNYDEPNEYYRELNGLPPIGTVGGMIVTSIRDKSLEVVSDDDYELLTDYTSMRLSETSAYNIMGNNLFNAGNHVFIKHAIIQNEKTSYSRSFLIVPDDYPIDKSSKSVFLRDVKSIMYSINTENEIPGEEIIGKYFHVNLENTLDTTGYFKYSYLVVEDEEENYDKNTMIKISEAVLNNKNASLGDYLLLGNFHYVTSEISEMYGISTKVPIHLISSFYGDRFINILESSGYLNYLCEKYPDEKYLKFIGEKRIDIIKARTAKNFDILYMPSCKREVIEWSFAVSYNGARDYFVNTVYNYYYRNIYDYYDNFIGLAIVQLAISQTIAKGLQTAIDRDFYDETMVRLLFEMYGVPYYPTLPYQTQRRLVKNLNYLIQNKSTSNVILDIASIMGYHDINIYKYYLVKERKFDTDGNLIYKDTTSVEPTLDVDGLIKDKEVVVNDLKNMYDVYFQKVKIDESNFQVALTDSANRVSYDSITMNDPLWWDDTNTFEEVYGDHTKYTADTEPNTYHTHYNFRETKYLGMSISYKMSEVLYENILLLKVLMEKKDELNDIFVTLPKITGNMNISIFEIVVYLCALISKQYHLKGEILTRYSSVMDAMGYITEDIDGYIPCDTLSFNFDLLTNADTYKEIIKNPSRYLKDEEKQVFFNYLSVLTLNQVDTSKKITAINDMYQNIKGLGYFLGRKMSEADNLFEYRAWRDFYNALFIGKENASIFKLGNTDRVATTYLEYLSVMNPSLYTSIEEADSDTIYTYIDHTISRLEKVVYNLKSLYTVNDSNSSLLNYLIKLIKFFKSYTTDLIDVTTEYVFDMRPDNLFKMVEYYKIHQVIITKDTYNLMYSDTMKILETIKEIDPLKYKEIIRLSKENIFTDVFSLNRINCNSCKNFGNCRNFCKNDKESCLGTYKENREEVPCRFYGYDTSNFLKYIDHYRDLLLSVDYMKFEDVKASVRSHLKKAYTIYKTIDLFNPYEGNEMTFSPEKQIDLLYESLDRINELLEKHQFEITISSSGVDGIVDWIDLLTVTGSNIKRVCKNKKYPCRDMTCHLRDTKEEFEMIETLHHNESLSLSVKYDMFATLWVEERNLFSHDEIGKLIEYRYLNDEKKYSFKDFLNLKKEIIFDDKTMQYMDTLKSISKTDEVKDSLRFKDEVIMYEEP